MRGQRPHSKNPASSLKRQQRITARWSPARSVASERQSVRWRCAAMIRPSAIRRDHSSRSTGLVGMDVQVRDSGKYRGPRKLPKTGEPELRGVLFSAAMQGRQSPTGSPIILRCANGARAPLSYSLASSHGCALRSCVMTPISTLIAIRRVTLRHRIYTLTLRSLVARAISKRLDHCPCYGTVNVHS